VRHLLLNAQGTAVRAVAVGSDTTVVFEPQDAAHAGAILDGLVATLARGLCEPLPIECRAALRAYDEGELNLEAARDAYDGLGNQAGQSAWAPEVARFYPLFADMEARGFAAIADALYTPMVAACR